jgi:glycosyltransferase involved in cell wall biosynthesis
VSDGPRLSIVVPTFNSARTLRACLESARFADELLVVDSFSSDDTVAIAGEYADRVVQHEYENSAAQKNWILPQAAHEWVMILDSDEMITPELRDAVQAALRDAPGDVGGFRMLRRTWFLGRLIRYSGWQRDRLVRLFRRDGGRYEIKRVHAEAVVDGRVEDLAGELLHDSYADLSDYLKRLDRYTTWAAQDLLDRGKPVGWGTLAVRPPATFLRDYVVRQGFRDGVPGLILCQLNGFYVLVKYAKYWRLRRRA